jgi:L-ascorbate metabolism protein UlaG (beta-lactamase superfamily)
LDKLYFKEKNRFHSKYDGFKDVSFKDVLKWKCETRGQNKNEKYELEIKNEIEKLKTEKDYIVWLGHSTFLIQISGKRVITDPVFGDIPFVKRVSKTPYEISELPKIDYVLISHSHYDHLDKNSIKSILKYSTPKILVPLGTKKYLKNFENVVEMDWFESLEEDLKIKFLPAKHWGRRGAFDLNKSLWGSFLIENIYFAGDTSYSDHFEMIGNSEKVDIALIPIGAYKPEKIMKNNHINPEEAVKSSIDLKANFAIPMHYGTFKLSDEPLSEPLELFKKEAEKKKLNIKIPKLGEVLYFLLFS